MKLSGRLLAAVRRGNKPALLTALALAGTYAVAGDRPLRVVVEPMEGGLRLRGDGGLEATALPLSPTRFRWEGGPAGFGFEFSEDGRTLTLRAEGEPYVLTRRP